MRDFLTAVGLVFAIEGLLLAAFPEAMRKAMADVAASDGHFLRRIGLISAAVGVVIVFLLRGLDL
jgi:uncharacterized protein YjeT (DUF2065 family)